jgi:hypothetical protein
MRLIYNTFLLLLAVTTTACTKPTFQTWVSTDGDRCVVRPIGGEEMNEWEAKKALKKMRFRSFLHIEKDRDRFDICEKYGETKSVFILPDI